MMTEGDQKAGPTSDPEVYDVILNVSSHGIHNPYNIHAFKSQRIYLIPTKCYFCSSTIYPYSDAARCIRCGSYVHRSCCSTRNAKLVCQGWSSSCITDTDIETDTVINPDNPSTAGVSTGDGTLAPLPLSVVAPPRLVTLLHIPEFYDITLPQPGTPHCVWKRSLQELSKDYYLTRMATVPKTSLGIEKLVNRLLSDNSTFPGRVFKELRDLYMYLKFSQDTDYLVHAREALDNIACAVVSILPAEVGDDIDSLKLVVTVVDWRVLRQADGSMYDKVFGAARRHSTRMDNTLLARLYQQQEKEQQAAEDRRRAILRMTPGEREELTEQQLPVPSVDQVVDMPHYEAIHIKLGKIPGEYAVMDKLERLVETLKLIATSAPPKDNVKLSDSASPGLDEDGPELTLEETMQNYDIDADSLMQKFCQILSYETLKYEFYWNAESVFVDYMCREYNWLLGAEGYALVTLQQALRSLCPPIATKAKGKAAQSNGDKHHSPSQPAGSSLYSSSRDSRDDDTRSRYSISSSSKDEDDWRSDTLGLSIHNNEILVSSSSKMKGIAISHTSASPSGSDKVSTPVLGSE